MACLHSRVKIGGGFGGWTLPVNEVTPVISTQKKPRGGQFDGLVIIIRHCSNRRSGAYPCDSRGGFGRDWGSNEKNFLGLLTLAITPLHKSLDVYTAAQAALAAHWCWLHFSRRTAGCIVVCGPEFCSHGAAALPAGRLQNSIHRAKRWQTSRTDTPGRRVTSTAEHRYRCHIAVRCSMSRMSPDFTDVWFPMFTSVVLYCLWNFNNTFTVEFTDKQSSNF